MISVGQKEWHRLLAFLYPTSFGSRLRWEHRRFEAKHLLSKNH
ncbi:MAG TPA: hypothetical protein DDX19_12215 [Rhodopirellula baltica]|nr:hypothetical protein [Rhodopirellula baltica]